MKPPLETGNVGRQPMNGSLLDDLARLSAMPMSRARALRLMSSAVVGAFVTLWWPRDATALSCAATTCAPATPDLCCIDFPTNPTASINTCCKSTDRCCKFFTPEGGSFASVTCCKPTQACRMFNPPMEAAFCEDCGPNPVACGTEPCCPAGYLCIASQCCPQQLVCGAVCCGTNQSCVNGTCTTNSLSCQFTDNPLVGGTTVVKATHITELRSCITAQRIRFGLPLFVFTDGSLTGVNVKTIHVLELRTALNGAYVAALRPVPTYTDPTFTAHQTIIKAVHIQELRAALVALNSLVH